MRIIFKKATKVRGKKQPVGHVMVVTPQKAERLLNSGIAEEYKGVFPPTGKVKVKVDLKQLKG